MTANKAGVETGYMLTCTRIALFKCSNYKYCYELIEVPKHYGIMGQVIIIVITRT